MKYREIKVGNIVRVEAKPISREMDLIGTIKAIYPHHVLVVDCHGIWHSIHPSDLKYMHLIEDAGFEEYSEENYMDDIKDAFAHTSKKGNES